MTMQQYKAYNTIPIKVQNVHNIKSQYPMFMSSFHGPPRVTSLEWKLCHTSQIPKDDWQIRVMFCFLNKKKNSSWKLKTLHLSFHLELMYNRSLQRSMANFYREFPQLRCTELQLKMRLAGLHLQLKRVAHEHNTRLAVSSPAQRGSVADKWVK